jgi:hypothetical protein
VRSKRASATEPEGNKALDEETSRTRAVEILRGLIDEVRLSPRNGKLDFHLIGNLAPIFGLCAKEHPGAKDTGGQIPLVPGARSEPWAIPALPVTIRSR